jgi:hypothetical protein
VVDAAAEAADDGKARQTFLALLARFNAEGRDLSDKPGRNFAPAAFAKCPDADGLGKAAFKAAMDRLCEENLIHVEVSGPPTRRKIRLVCGPYERPTNALRTPTNASENDPTFDPPHTPPVRGVRTRPPDGRAFETPHPRRRGRRDGKRGEG